MLNVHKYFGDNTRKLFHSNHNTNFGNTCTHYGTHTHACETGFYLQLHNYN